MRALTFVAALLVSTLGCAAWAQSDAEQQGPHLDQKEAPAAKPATPPEPQGGTGPSQGMMGGGMMNMMGGNMQMPDMMRMMGMMRQSSDGMGGMDSIDHVEGRIAFLKTELKITDAQTAAWNSFADALRSNAKTVGDLRSSMMSQTGSGPGSLVERLTWQEKWLSVRLESTRAMKSALTNLASSFSDEQKKAADELLASQMGMMPMMPSMRSGSTMGMGMMSGGKSPK